MVRLIRTLGRTGQVATLAVLVAIVAGAGVALGAVSAAKRGMFARPVPGTMEAVAPLAPVAQRAVVSDSTRVRQLLESARGVNGLVCDLAARTVDGRSGWWSGSDVIASGDTGVRDVVSWVQHREMDPSSVPVLRTALADADPCVRRLAAPLLGRIRHPSASQAMLSALAAAEPTVREMGALALGFSDDTTGVGPLERRLREDSSPRVRATAAWALGEIERPESARVLVDALRDTDALVRRNAAHALGEIENPVAIPALTDLLKSDGDADVRRAAAQALGEIVG
jgi:hypothetical protein